MSSGNTDLDYFVESKDSDFCSLPEYDINQEDGDLQVTPVRPSKSEESLDSCDLAYADELTANEVWLKQYEKEQKRKKKFECMLEERLNGTTQVDY